MDDTVDILHAGIIDYLGQDQQTAADLKDRPKSCCNLMEAVSNLENIGDIVETNLVVLGQDRIQATRLTSARQTQGGAQWLPNSNLQSGRCRHTWQWRRATSGRRR
jgi:Na+/phosphate symporter